MKKVEKAQKAKHVFGLEEKLLLGIVGVSVLMIIAAFSVKLLPTPTEQADAKLEEIANDYYLTYLYPRLMGANKDLEQAFKKYDKVGVPTVYLRQLLHYNDDQYAETAETFATVGCDTNQTGVRYYPKEPYGPHDYEVKYLWECSAKAE